MTSAKADAPHDPQGASAPRQTGSRKKGRKSVKRLGALLRRAGWGGRRSAGGSVVAPLSPGFTADLDASENDDERIAVDPPPIPRCPVSPADLGTIDPDRDGAEERECAGDGGGGSEGSGLVRCVAKSLVEGTMAEGLDHITSDTDSDNGPRQTDPAQQPFGEERLGGENGTDRAVSSSRSPDGKQSEDDGDDIAEAPRILRPWIRLHRCIPHLAVPGAPEVDFSFALASAAALNLLRLFFLRLLVRIGWPGESTVPPGSGGWAMTLEAAGSLTSVVQSLCLITGVAACLLSRPYVPSARMDDSPRWWRDAADALLQLCTGYMLYDALVLLFVECWDGHLGRPVLTASDWLFAAHHAATAFYMTTARLAGAGHQSAMILMCTGEATSPLMNAHIVLRMAVRLRCCGGPLAHTLLKYVEYTFAAAYSFFRIIVGPAAAAHLTYDLLFTKQGRQNVPVWLSLSVWMPMCWGVLIGSIPWIKETLGMLRDGMENVKYGPDYDWGDRYGYYNEL